MAYSKQNFQDGQILSAANLEKMENGIIAAQNPRNLLDNSDFSNPVNQRGGTSYSGSGYSIDRWYGNGSNQIVQVFDSCVKVSATGTSYCGLRQKVLRMASLAGKTITFAAKVYSNVVPSIRFINANASTLAYKDGTNGTTTTIVLTYTVPSGATLDTVIPIIIAKTTAADDYINIYWAAIYEGSYTADTLPEYVPKGYAMEFAECNRCYKILNIYIPPWLIEGTNIRRYGISYRPMRIPPTADVSGLKEYATWTDLGSTINPYNSASDRLLMSATTETSSTRVYLAGTLKLSAEP